MCFLYLNVLFLWIFLSIGPLSSQSTCHFSGWSLTRRLASPPPPPPNSGWRGKHSTDHSGDDALHKTYVKCEWHCLWWELQGHSGAFFIKKTKKNPEETLNRTSWLDVSSSSRGFAFLWYCDKTRYTLLHWSKKPCIWSVPSCYLKLTYLGSRPHGCKNRTRESFMTNKRFI